MRTYGHVIKFERIRQNIKQVQLSKDICTPSYLSKIESNSIVPSEEIREKLFKLLNINPSPSSLSEEDYLKHVRSIYFEAVMYKDRQKTELILNELENKYFLFQNATNFYTYQLMMLRLNIIVFDIQPPTEEAMKAISEIAKDFNDYQNFMFKVNLGIFYFFKQDYHYALESLENAFEYKHRIKCEKWEVADLEYVLGLTYLYQYRNVAAIQYSKEAITYFESEFYNTRAIESYIVLAIAYRRAEKYKETFEILQLAKKISIELDIKENFPHIFYNLGTVLAEQGEVESAIENFEECLALTSDYFGKATSMCAIMIEHAKRNDSISVISWCDKGITICKNAPDNMLEIRIHHFNCYLARFSKSDKFEETFKVAISYFEKKKDFRHSHKYAIQLAQFYLDTKKYKKAATYYSLANDYLAKKENRKFMEDI